MRERCLQPDPRPRHRLRLPDLLQHQRSSGPSLPCTQRRLGAQLFRKASGTSGATCRCVRGRVHQLRRSSRRMSGIGLEAAEPTVHIGRLRPPLSAVRGRQPQDVAPSRGGVTAPLRGGRTHRKDAPLRSSDSRQRVRRAQRFQRHGRASVTPLHGSHLGQPRLGVFVVPADSGDPGRRGLRGDVVRAFAEITGVVGQHQVEIRDVDV
jgi:hypothetical protein